MPPRPPKSNAALAASLVALIGACAALPYFLSRAPSESRRIDTNKPLAPSTGVRGPYVNTGSRDIGPDLPAKGQMLGASESLSSANLGPRHGSAGLSSFKPFRGPPRNAQTAHQPMRGHPWQVQAALMAPHGPQDSSAPEKAEAPGCALRAARQLVAAALASLQMATVPFAAELARPAPAAAVLNSPNARIARSADAALRRSIPAFNKDLREVQTKLEDVAFKLRIPQRKPWPAMVDDVRAASSIVSQSDRVLYGVPRSKEEDAQALTATISSGLRGVMGAIDAKDADKVSRRIADVLKDVATLEILQAPGLTFKIPELFASIPRLTGRATVELIIERKGDAEAYVTRSGGGPVSQARIGITLDGYSAPLTAGNFAANVQDGVYDGKPVNASYASVLAGRGAIPGKVLPLEILPLGEFDPVYRSTLDVQNGELPVLPLSIYGAVAMAHAPADEAPLPDGYSVSDEFFVYKFSKEQAGLSGLAFDEGIFSVFGYVTQGLELVQQLQGDDVIVSSRLVTGAERLVRPAVADLPADGAS